MNSFEVGEIALLYDISDRIPHGTKCTIVSPLMHHRCLKTGLDILSHHIALHIDFDSSGWLCAELIDLKKFKEHETS